MNDKYFEILIKRKTSPVRRVGQLAAAVLAGVFALLGFIGILWALILAAVLGVVCYILTLSSNVEYEYLYVDKELQIDRILAKTKRKKMESLDLRELEVLAPVRSHNLDSYRNKNYTKKDYTSGETGVEIVPYMLIVNGKQILFEPTEEMVKSIQMIAPRKVFTY